MEPISELMAGFPGQWASGALLPNANTQITRVLGVWLAAKNDAELPSFGEIGPNRLKFVLPDVHLYAVAPDVPRYVIRLIGTRMTDQIGASLAGKPVDAVPQDKLRLAMTMILRAVEASRVPLHIKAPRAIALPNGDHQSLESLWCPCASDGSTIDRIFAVSLLSSISI